MVALISIEAILDGPSRYLQGLAASSPLDCFPIQGTGTSYQRVDFRLYLFVEVLLEFFFPVEGGTACVFARV